MIDPLASLNQIIIEFSPMIIHVEVGGLNQFDIRSLLLMKKWKYD